jgi:hypothetical protein
MTMTNVEIGHARATRSRETKVAIKHLEASAIAVTVHSTNSPGAIPEILDFPN